MNGNVEMIRETLQQAQAIVIGAGAGLSAAAGLTYGAFGGLFVCLAGIFIGSTIVFLVVKRYGQPVVDRMFPREKQEKLSFLRDADKLGKIVFILYLIPAMPKAMLRWTWVSWRAIWVFS